MTTLPCRQMLMLLVPVFFQISHAGLHPQLARLLPKDTTVNAWIVFADKPPIGIKSAVAKRAAARRAQAGFPLRTSQDMPVSAAYIDAVVRQGATLRHVFKWENAVSFAVPSATLSKIAALPYVKEVFAVASYRPVRPAKSLRKGRAEPSVGRSYYGQSFAQLSIIGVAQAHSYLAAQGLTPGNGAIIGVFDEGFWLGHKCFNHIVQNRAVLADSDFVTGSSDPYVDFADHGTQTMALIGGYDKNSFIGVAWGATFIIARTEEGFDSADNNIERHIEEDNWAAAMVWAESLGVDIVSSSLGYFNMFTDSLGDYTFNDMDGNTTIISRAAKGAAQRGVLIVNAMGNSDDNPGRIINAPADVEDVIAVGAISLDGQIASFSCRGPTADGRIKPDVVAVGSSAMVPAKVGYTYLQGTSFSTPMVAGVVALVKQAYPTATAAQIRQKLYRSCTFAPYQDSVDNIYGRGIPDALLACLDESQSYLAVTDTARNVIAGAVLYRAGETVAVTDSFGVAVVNMLPGSAAETLQVSHRYFVTKTVAIDSGGMRIAAVLDSGNILYVEVTDTGGNGIAAAKVYARRALETECVQYETADNGIAIIERTDKGNYIVYASALGYKKSDDSTVAYTSSSDKIRLVLDARPVSQLAVYPTVLSLRDIEQSAAITIDFLASEDAFIDYDQMCKIAIRTIDGDAVWTYASLLGEFRPVSDAAGNPLTWNCRSRSGKIVAPGVYILTVSYGGKLLRRKILIRG